MRLSPISVVTLVVALMSFQSLYACSIPVFCYALAYWPPDNYQVIVFHSGPLSLEEQTVVEWLQKCSSNQATSEVNLEVSTVDLASSLDDGNLELHEAHSLQSLPWMVVRYPVRTNVGTLLWEGPVGMVGAKALVDSPARSEMARRILSGDSIVWVLLECGNATKDEAAVILLRTELGKLQQTLELPNLAETMSGGFEYSSGQAPTDEQLSPSEELQVVFSVIRVSRSDPAEQVFVRMLLNTEPDLRDFVEPIAFPVFGRGRVLYALVGKGINKENIEEACAFLVGWCSCQVKAENPGIDLLMFVDWEAGLKNRLVDNIELPPLTSLSGLAPQPTETRTMQTLAAQPLADKGSSSVLLRNILLVLGFIILVTIVLVFGIAKRKRYLRG